MIINDGKYPILWCGGQEPEHRFYYKDFYINPEDKYNWMTHVDHKDKKIFYVEFFGHDAFKKYPLEHYLNSNLINKLKNKEIHLLLHCSGHGYHYIPDELYQDIIIKYGIPESQIILSTESVDMFDAVQECAKNYNMEPVYTQWTTQFEHSQMSYANRVQINQFDFADKDYEKKFLCLNGNFWFHRSATVYLLACFDLIDKGFVSLNIKNPDSNTSMTLMHLIGVIDDDEVCDLFNKNRNKLLKIDRILLDYCFQKGENIAELLPEHNHYFTNSYFSLVTETNFPVMRFAHEKDDYRYRVGRLLSEKIFRTILYKHPFLAVACPGFLKTLHYLGYKTFDGIIDESYDNEQNNGTRLLKIIKEVKRISDFSDAERNEFLSKVKDICDYNYQVLLNKQKFVHKLPIIT